jgi:hypothetical protein
MAYVCVTDNCWPWEGYRNPLGYGHYRYDGKNARAYRISYELFIGKIPEKMDIDHICRNPACVNPEHLEAVTHRENMRRGIGFAGVNARKENCSKGHPFTKENTYLEKGLKRHCRICRDLFWVKNREIYNKRSRDLYLAHKKENKHETTQGE